MNAEPFDPWRAAESHDDLILAVHPVAGVMGGGFHARHRGHAVIVVDPALDGAARRAVLTHELVHHERGGSIERRDVPAGLRALVDREERAVDREVARRLVPRDALAAFVGERTSAGGSVDADEVAAQFEVPHDVAELALIGFAAERRDPDLATRSGP
jgi:hypothetical protein